MPISITFTADDPDVVMQDITDWVSRGAPPTVSITSSATSAPPIPPVVRFRDAAPAVASATNPNVVISVPRSPNGGVISDPAVPPVPPVPSTPPVPPVAPGPPDLDARGFPWDARIHSGVKTKKKDGTWKNARGKGADLVASVEAELTAAIQAAGYQTPAMRVKEIAAAVNPNAAIPVAPPPPLPPRLVIPPVTQSVEELYPLVATKMSNAITSGMISSVRCGELVEEHEAKTLPELAGNAEALTAINAALDAEIARVQAQGPVA